MRLIKPFFLAFILFILLIPAAVFSQVRAPAEKKFTDSLIKSGSDIRRVYLSIEDNDSSLHVVWNVKVKDLDQFIEFGKEHKKHSIEIGRAYRREVLQNQSELFLIIQDRTESYTFRGGMF